MKLKMNDLCVKTVLTGLLFFHANECFSDVDDNIKTIAVDSYIYAYPLVTMDMTREVGTNVVKPEGTKAPMGQFAHLRTYPNATFKDITAPNADTLYSSAFLDLLKEPYILHVPDENDRYYLMETLSAWTDVIADPGTRTTGSKAQDFVFTGPDFKGTLPEGVKEYKSPTNLIWILGRTYSTGTKEDYEIVHKIQDEYSLKPLSFYGKPYTPKEGIFNPNLDIKTPLRDQVNNLSGEKFFSRFAKLLKNNPPKKEDAEMVQKLAKLGIIPGQDFDISKVDLSIKEALLDAPKKGLEKIIAYEKHAGEIINGWLFSNKLGTYGTNYDLRAFVTYYGLGANLPEDAIYPISTVDNHGNLLSGKNRYIIHFEKGQKPPVKGFWSLTMYDDQYFFVQNKLNRYNLSSRNEFKTNDDGSIDLYIQHESPGVDKENNWLPAPEGNFVLMFRFYWPEKDLIDGNWEIPAVKIVE